jgi:ATP-dependent Lon protease
MKVVESREDAVGAANDETDEKSSVGEDKSDSGSSLDLSVTEESLGALVGKPPFTSDRLYEGPLPVGTVTGLAWTAMGGSVLYMEASALPRIGGKASAPSLSVTGQLGDVMKESSQLALLLARRYLGRPELSERKAFFEENEIHIHCPEGATPKDGPSAGVTMVTALLSLGLDTPVRVDLAMTGEVSLNGKVLPIGGVKEKTIAARRAGCKVLVFPQANRRDFDELPAYLKEGLDVHYASDYDDVFAVAFPDACSA